MSTIYHTHLLNADIILWYWARPSPRPYHKKTCCVTGSDVTPEKATRPRDDPRRVMIDEWWLWKDGRHIWKRLGWLIPDMPGCLVWATHRSQRVRFSRLPQPFLISAARLYDVDADLCLAPIAGGFQRQAVNQSYIAMLSSIQLISPPSHSLI